MLLSCRIQSDPNEDGFKKNWRNFDCPNWTVNFNYDQSEYMETPIDGRLIFRNKIDTSLTITYYVYRKVQLDGKFENKRIHWLMIQSCIEESPLSDFNYYENYYMLKPCQKCKDSNKNDCEALANKLKIL